MLEAKDLPANHLSNLLEQRVLNALATDRQQRAAMQGKPLEEIPTADSLTVRVINNVIKKCEVRAGKVRGVATSSDLMTVGRSVLLPM